MKRLFAIAAVALLAPGVSRADEPSAQQPAPAPAPAAATAQAPAATATAKPEEKKDDKPAEATTQNASLMTPEQLAALGKWTFNFGLDNIVGSGTFVNSEYYAFVGSALSLSWTKPLPVKLGGKSLLFNGGTGLNVEYTKPDSLNGRRVGWSDVRLGIAVPGAIKDARTGISINPSIGATIPITLESWGAGTITNLTAGVRAIRRFGPVDLRLGVTGGYVVNTSPYVKQYASVGPDNIATALCRVSDPSCGTGGLTNKFTLGTNLVALWFFNDDLLFYGTLGWNVRWRNAATMEVDAYTPKGVDVNGNPVAQVGMRPSDMMSGALGVNYTLTDVFSLSFTLSNDGPVKTLDNKSIRNPFVDFISPANNLTNYTLSLYATL